MIYCQGSVGGSVIQATGDSRVYFENGLRKDNQSSWKQPSGVSTIHEINAIIIFKGHGKVKTSDRSYRTISTCPVVVKAMDLYVRKMNISRWSLDQSCTQFQGQESSHELAAILLTESIQHSLFALKKPVFVLYLDAQSAFDVVLHELLIRKLHFCGTRGQSLLYINNRLQNRQTFIEWDGSLMGPIFT